MTNGLYTYEEAIEAAKTSRSSFARAIDILDIPNIKLPKDRRRYFKQEHIDKIKAWIYQDKELIEPES